VFVRQSLKSCTGINTLAYHKNPKITEAKSFITSAPWLSYTPFYNRLLPIFAPANNQRSLESSFNPAPYFKYLLVSVKPGKDPIQLYCSCSSISNRSQYLFDAKTLSIRILRILGVIATVILSYTQYTHWVSFCWFPDPGFQILDSRSWIPDPGFQILDSRSWIPGSGFHILDFTSWIPEPIFWIPCSILKILDSG